MKKQINSRYKSVYYFAIFYNKSGKEERRKVYFNVTKKEALERATWDSKNYFEIKNMSFKLFKCTTKEITVLEEING